MADLNRKFKNFTNTKDTTDQFDPKDIQENKVMAIIAYLSWLVIIPILAAKNSRFARFHSNQGLMLAIIEIIVSVVFSILSAIPIIGIIFAIIEGLIWLVCLGFSIIGILNANNGLAKVLPVFGDRFTILKTDPDEPKASEPAQPAPAAEPAAVAAPAEETQGDVGDLPDAFPEWVFSPITDTSVDEDDEYISTLITAEMTDDTVAAYQTVLKNNGFEGDFQIMRKTVEGRECIVDFSFVPDSQIRYLIKK